MTARPCARPLAAIRLTAVTLGVATAAAAVGALAASDAAWLYGGDIVLAGLVATLLTLHPVLTLTRPRPAHLPGRAAALQHASTTAVRGARGHPRSGVPGVPTLTPARRRPAVPSGARPTLPAGRAPGIHTARSAA